MAGLIWSYFRLTNFPSDCLCRQQVSMCHAPGTFLSPVVNPSLWNLDKDRKTHFPKSHVFNF